MTRTPTFWTILLLPFTACFGARSAINIQMVDEPSAFISPGDDWRFFRGNLPPSDPPTAWRGPLFDDSSWETGPSGFGYGDNDDATELTEMQNGYLTVYIRKEFQVTEVTETLLELVIDYDDGFVAYLNGTEIERQHLPAGEPTFETAATSHEAGEPETYTLGPASELLVEGRNVLAALFAE